MSERISRIDFVKQKYRLDELCFIDGENNGKKLGHGKVMADDTLQRFIDADPSGTGKYLDWMLFMAGGGQAAIEKSLRLWDGQSSDDPNALRNQCHRDFVAEQMTGYTDDQHILHQAVSPEQAEVNWHECEERCRFEFLMGDQDIAIEDGYGFYRFWPGKDRVYERVIDAIQLWHSSQQRLVQQNQQFKRAERLRSGPVSLWGAEDRKFMSEWEAGRELVELDIYAGWKPREYSQAKARYKSIEALLAPLKDIRKAVVLKDERFDLVYEDEIVRAICPLTVGASLKYGCIKWCVANRTDFDKSFEANGDSSQHWKTYTEKGPLVYLLFKVAMPAYCHRLAVQLQNAVLKNCTAANVTEAKWYDCKNEQAGFTRTALFGRIEAEHTAPEVWHKIKEDDDKGLAFGGWPTVRAWNDPAQGHRVLYAINTAAEGIAAWARKFDRSRVVSDYLTESRSVVKLND